MDRRTFLKATGVASMGGITSLAGCTAPGEGGEETTGAETTAGGTTGTTEGAGGAQQTTEGEGATTQAGTTAGGGAQDPILMVTEGSEFFFDPVGLYVEPGTTITWEIESGSHSTTAYDESLDSANTTRIPQSAEPWDSGILSQKGATFDYTFEVEGTYDYFCIPHKQLGMVGRIVCGQPSSGERPELSYAKLPAEERIVEQGVVSYEQFSGGGTTTSQ